MSNITDAAWKRLIMALDSLRIVIRNAGTLTPEVVDEGNIHAKHFEHIELFARHAKEAMLELEKLGEIGKQKRMSDKLVPEGEQQNTLGNTAALRFPSFGNKEVNGKVDSGATTSSLHAVDVNTKGSSVTFSSPPLSDKMLTMDLVGQQDVSSADGGTQQRPMVKLDVDVNGILIKGVTFNLNDRSNMDTPVLIGQNILKDGNFVVDVSAEDKQPEQQEQRPAEGIVRNDQKIIEAINTLRKENITFEELFEYLKTEAVNSIKE